jgi:hypothetical protein
VIALTHELLALFGVAERPQIKVGEVFYIRKPHVRYHGNREHERPAVVARIELAANADAAIVYLYYTTTTGTPPPDHRIDLKQGEGGLFRSCRLDLAHPPLRIPAASLLEGCDQLDQLDDQRVADMDAIIQNGSRVPRWFKRLPR